jgi:hypothetical protein
MQDSSMRTEKDVESLLRLPVVAVISEIQIDEGPKQLRPRRVLSNALEFSSRSRG